MLESKEWHITALTDIWTGDINRAATRTINTGLLGSIRWWFEVLVRGLDGHACDPTKNGNRCPSKDGRHCVVCELFGCTGWARKFRFEVLKTDRSVKKCQIKKCDKIIFHFTPLRPICDEEWLLLNLTLKLIAEYGAIGGKTVYKPSDEQGRQNLPHHQDFGLIKITKYPSISSESKSIVEYIVNSRWHRPSHNNFAWASLSNFWCVKGRYLARQDIQKSTFNRVIERPESKKNSSNQDSWKAGSRAQKGSPAVSKKVFSFKKPSRTFGFVESPDDISKVLEFIGVHLKNEWKNFSYQEFTKSNNILPQILS